MTRAWITFVLLPRLLPLHRHRVGHRPTEKSATHRALPCQTQPFALHGKTVLSSGQQRRMRAEYTVSINSLQDSSSSKSRRTGSGVAPHS